MRIEFDAELFGMAVRHVLRDAQISHRRLEQMSGVSVGNLQRVIRGKGLHSLTATLSIADALRLPIEPFLTTNALSGYLTQRRKPMNKDMRIAQLEAQLRKDRNQFAFYARSHRNKALISDNPQVTEDALAKATTNENMVGTIDALIGIGGEPDVTLHSELNKDSSRMSRPTHAQMVAVLQKPGVDIMASLTPHKADMLHMALGIASEGGEVADAIKKWAIYGKELDRANVVEELGDLEFFMEGLRRELGITREETLEANIDKLGERYNGFVYSDRAAIERADKA